MLAIRLSNKIEQRIMTLAQKTGRSKIYYVRKAIENFLEDEEDYFLGLAALERKESTIDLKKLVLKSRCGKLNLMGRVAQLLKL